MKYLLYIVFFLTIAGTIWLLWNYYQRLSYDLFYKLTVKSLSAKQKKCSGERFFSSLGLKMLIKFLLKKRAKKELILLTQGHTDKVREYLCEHNKDRLVAFLEAFEHPQKAIGLYEKLVIQKTNDQNLKAELAWLWQACGERHKAQEIWNKLELKKLPNYARAVKNFFMSQEMLSEGEMCEASIAASRAIALFEKEKAFYEVGRAYILMGTIYRIAAVNDVADSMFVAARKIFEKINMPEGQADALGNLGMLMIVQKRFEEAEDFFDRALNLNRESARPLAEAEIINQQSLMLTTQKQYVLARKTAEAALKLHQKLKNKQGQAFSWDIISYINKEEKKFAELLVSAETAIKLYDKKQGIAPILELLYLQASAYFELEQYEKTEKLLRKIIKKALGNCCSFHIANAYNLLGLIYLQQKDLRRAKGWFQQAVGQEEKNERLNCAAIDYANIAIIERRIGQNEQAQKTLDLAIKYAEAYEDVALQNELKKLNHNSARI